MNLPNDGAPVAEPIRVDHPDFVAFLKALVEQQDLDIQTLLYVVSKPWKWQGEFELWLLTGKVESDDDDSD